MDKAINILDKRRRDLLGAANSLELRMGEMLDPHTEATVDQVRAMRVEAEEMQRAIAVLREASK